MRRKIMQLEIEEMALKKEDDQLSQDRLAKLAQELAELQATTSTRMKAQLGGREEQPSSEVQQLRERHRARCNAEIEEAAAAATSTKRPRALQYSDLPELREAAAKEAEAAAERRERQHPRARHA